MLSPLSEECCYVFLPLFEEVSPIPTLISFFHTTPDWFFLNAFTLDFAFLASLSMAHAMNLISAIKFFTPPINKVFVQVPANQL